VAGSGTPVLQQTPRTQPLCPGAFRGERVAVGRIWPLAPLGKDPSVGCVLMLFSTLPATTPRPVESCAPSELPRRAWHARQVAESHRGVYFALETGQERATGRLGRFFGVTLGVEAVGSQAGAKGSLCRGQAPAIMHSDPSLPVAPPPVAFRRSRAAMRTQIRGARYSYQWKRDGRSRAEPFRDGAPIDSQHLSQQHSQMGSRDDFFGSTITQCGSARPGDSQQHSQDYSQQHSQTQVAALWMKGLGRSDARGGVVPVVVAGLADGHDRVRRTSG